MTANGKAVSGKRGMRTRSGSAGSDGGSSSHASELPSNCITVLQILEGHTPEEKIDDRDSSARGVTEFPSSVVAVASGKLLSVLSDIGTVSIEELNVAASTTSGMQDKRDKNMYSLLEDHRTLVLFAVDCVSVLLKAGMPLLAKESIGGPEGSISGHGEDEGAVSAFSQAVAALASVRESSLPPVLEKSERGEKLVSMLSQLLGQAVIMLVSATHEISSSVSELGSILPAIVDVLEGRTKKKKQLESKKSNKSKKSKKEADEVLEVEESKKTNVRLSYCHLCLIYV